MTGPGRARALGARHSDHALDARQKDHALGARQKDRVMSAPCTRAFGAHLEGAA
jgi:hypothetical protein